MNRGLGHRAAARLLWTALGLLLLVMAGAGTLLELTLPRLEGTISVRGPKAPVEIGRDGMGVVTIRAASEADAAFALGFAHAQDRLFQMDLTRRLGAGRLSEVVGSAALPTDEFMRRIGLYRVAEANYRAMPAAVRPLFESYAAGVNAALARDESLLPPEFLLLGYRPEPWQPADTLVWGRLMAWQLSNNWMDERLRRALAERLPPQELQWLWPEVQRLSKLRWMPIAGASNNWVISSSRSATGKPLLANDPHLHLGLPAAWYLVRLEIAGRVLAGASAPGVPLIIIGRNDHVAWGLTTAQADTEDLFVETLLDDAHYATPQGPAPLLRREEVIRVHGATPVTLTVSETRHGPLIEIDPRTHRGYALAWTGLRSEDRTPLAILGMDRAENAAQFREALKDFESPVQNVVFADDAGNIGYVMAGRIPVRAHVEDASEMPVPGDRVDFDWIGAIPFDELPQAMNPPEGYIATANNRTIAPGYAHFITGRFDADYRIDRIREMITAAPRSSREDMVRMQMDGLSLAARRLVPLLLAKQPDPALEGWDGRIDRNRPEPLIFEAWLRELAHVLLDTRLGPDFGDFWFWDAALIEEAVRGGPASALCDDPQTPRIEDCAIQVRRAHEQAMARLTQAFGVDQSAWRWGEVHRAHFPNPILSRIPVLGSLVDPDLATDGDNFTVNRASPQVDDATGLRFDDIHGASLRAVFDLHEPNRSLFEIAGGQSGNPVSPHYADFIPLWRDGRYVTMVGAERYRLTLLPEPAP